MTRSFKDTTSLNLLLTVVFILAALVSGYRLYSLPSELMLPEGTLSLLSKTYITIAFTFLTGGAAIYVAFRNRKEIIVYKEKAIESDQQEAQSNDTTLRSSISLDGIRSSLQQKTKNELLQNFIRTLCKQLEAGQGALYLTKEENGVRKAELHSGYSMHISESTSLSFEFGEGLVGQAAAEGRALYVDDIPEGYISVISGLGSASPRYLLIAPIKQQDLVSGVIEIASFTPFTISQRKFVEEAIQLLAEKITSA